MRLGRVRNDRGGFEAAIFLVLFGRAFIASRCSYGSKRRRWDNLNSRGLHILGLDFLELKS